MMIRAAILSSAILAGMSMLIASTASAAPTYSLLSPSTVNVNAGEPVTIEIALDNPGGDAVFGVVGSVSGLAAAGADATAGQSASVHFTGVCTATQCFGGLQTVDNPNFNPNDLPASGAYTPGNDFIVIVSALAASSTNQTGAADPGLIGGLDEPSALDVELTIVPTIEGTFDLTVAGEWSDGVDEIPTNAVTVTLNVPEPGAVSAAAASLLAVASVVQLRRRRS